jgi:hypothetical protein
MLYNAHRFFVSYNRPKRYRIKCIAYLTIVGAITEIRLDISHCC